MVDVTTKPSDTTPRQTGPGTQPGPYQNPGSDLYDWFTINDALRNADLNGWQIAGGSHSPVQTGRWVKDPAYDDLKTPQQNAADGHPDPYTYQEDPNGFVIGVVNPQTHQMLKLTLTRQGDPKTGYSWSVIGRENQGAIDKAQGGYANPQTLTFNDGHQELWGTNSTTGAFEKMPGSPPNLGAQKGWNDVKQIDDGQGHLIWVGTDPATGKPNTPIPNQPVINTSKYVPGSVKQVNVNGKLVYRGQNSQTQQWEDIPELGSENAPIQTTSAGGGVYQQNPRAGEPGQPAFIPASGIAQPGEGDGQWVDAGTGHVKHQTWHNGGWHDDPDIPQMAVSPETQRAEGALKPKGTRYYIPLSGSPDTLVEVTADGNGGYTYEPGPNGEPPKTMRIPGIAQPTTVTGGGTDEFLPSRRDPITQQLLPPEKNPNWQPSNVGDRVRQLQDQARSKQQELHQQVLSGAISEDQANQQFQSWWDTSIAPAKQEIDQAAQQKQLDEQIKINQQRQSEYSTAMQAGQNAVEAAKAQMPYMVGPGFGAALNNIQQSYATGKAPGNVDLASAVTFQMPDLQALATQATNQALAHISPTAAQGMNQATGANTPNYGPGLPQQAPSYNYTQALDANKYMPSGATTTIAPDGTVTIQHGQTGTTQPTTQPATTPPAMPGGYAPSQPGTYGVLTGSMPQLSSAIAPYQLT